VFGAPDCFEVALKVVGYPVSGKFLYLHAAQTEGKLSKRAIFSCGDFSLAPSRSVIQIGKIMTLTKQDAVALVGEAVDEINQQCLIDVPLGKTEESLISGVLDSLGIVNLIVAIEAICEERYGSFISLADAAESRTESVFATIGSLADLVLVVLSDRS